MSSEKGFREAFSLNFDMGSTEGEPMGTEIERHAAELLKRLYQCRQDDGEPDVVIAEYLEELAQKTSYGYDLVDLLADLKWVKASNGPAGASADITAAGVQAVQQLRADQASRPVRTAVLRNRMIRWLDSQETKDEHPSSWEDFLGIAEATYNGAPFTERDVREAAEYLHRYDLIDAVHVEEFSEGWLHPRLTVEGRECVTDHGSDVAAYLVGRRTGGTTTTHHTTIHVSDNNGNLVIGGEHFTQNYDAGVDLTKLLDFAGGVRQILPVLGLDDAAQKNLAEQAAELHSEASSPAPDRGRLRQFVDRLLAGVNQAAPTVGRTMLLAAGDAAQKAVTGG